MNPHTARDFEITRITRRNILALVDQLNYQQMTTIPEGFSNSIVWNFAHNAVTHQLLTYGLVDEICPLGETTLSKFRKGSKGNNLFSEVEFEALRKNYIALIDQAESDYDKLKSKTFKPYSTSFNITLNNLDEALQFVNTHEGVHFGIMMAISKLV